MKVYALITPDDVRTSISNCFYQYRNLRGNHIGTIKSWIISRTDIVNDFQCFKLLLCHCDQVVAILTLEHMQTLLHTMKRCVYYCLNYKLIQRDRPSGERSGSWGVQQNIVKFFADDVEGELMLISQARSRLD